MKFNKIASLVLTLAFGSLAFAGAPEDERGLIGQDEAHRRARGREVQQPARRVRVRQGHPQPDPGHVHPRSEDQYRRQAVECGDRHDP